MRDKSFLTNFHTKIQLFQTMPRATRSSTKYNFRQIPKKNLNWNAMAPPLPSDDSENESGRDNLSASFSTSTSSNASFNESRTPQAKLCFNSKLLKPSVLRNNPIVTRRARHMPLINNTIELGSDEEKPQKRKTRGKSWITWKMIFRKILFMLSYYLLTFYSF